MAGEESVSESVSKLSLKEGIPKVQNGQRNVLVTSALPYVNNVPHLGNLIGAVLSADVYSRYLRQRSVNCLFICGTDEYGTATETKAQLENVTPKQICDHYHRIHADIYTWFDIKFDHFGRTSTKQQTEICQDIFWKVYKNGFIQEDQIEQLFCEKDQRFLADRFVFGTCPTCGYEDARGDQCENCGRMLNPSELIRPICSVCKSTPVSRSSKHLFLDLGQLQPSLEEWVAKTSVSGSWNSNAISMTNTWLRDGLKSRCITRDLKWGTPVPLQGFEDKVFYVWFDAPIGYVSITAALTPEWKEWWQSPDKVELVQFMGKDNVPFHSIVFPSTLLATKEDWTMVHHLSTTEYLNYETGKFSKTRGVGVFGNDAQSTGIGVEVWRYYLLVNRPEVADTVFTWDDFQGKNNNELLSNVGNYVNRTMSFVTKFFGKKLCVVELDEDDAAFVSDVNTDLKKYIGLMDAVQLKSALRLAMSISQRGNVYIQKNEPWELVKTDRARAGSVVSVAVHVAYLLGILLEPFLGGQFSNKIYKMLGVASRPDVNLIPDELFLGLGANHEVGDAELLFYRIDDEKIAALRLQFSGAQSESSGIHAAEQKAAATAGLSSAFHLDLRVGRLVEITECEGSDTLYVGKVDVGEESGPRALVAGLRGIYSKEELLNRLVVVVCNLQPASFAGITSQAMLLTAEKKKDLKLLSVPEDSAVGSLVGPGTFASSEDKTLLDRKGFQNAAKQLRVGNENTIVFDKQYVLTVASSGVAIGSGGVAEGGKIK
uniref:methionine--tRNA ligase n=1 Tax=Timspurckia oligopyrenoides TaxID=708627 RepID=A0A7S1ET68_9RHOD